MRIIVLDSRKKHRRRVRQAEAFGRRRAPLVGIKIAGKFLLIGGKRVTTD